MAVTATVDTVTAADSPSRVVTITALVTFKDGTTELGQQSFSTTTTIRTVAARTALEQTFANEINAAKATLASQQSFAPQCALMKTNIQTAVN